MRLLDQADVTRLEQPEKNCAFLPVGLGVRVTEPPGVPRGDAKARVGRPVLQKAGNVGERCPIAEVTPRGATGGVGPESKQPQGGGGSRTVGDPSVSQGPGEQVPTVQPRKGAGWRQGRLPGRAPQCLP